MEDFAPILKSPDEHRVKIKVVARCRDCKLEHREVDLTPEQWRHAVFDWLWKHQGHDCYFVSPKRTIPGRFRDWMFEKFGIADWWLSYGSNSDLKPALGAVTVITITQASLATNAAWTTGQQSTSVSNATDKFVDAKVTAVTMTGTTPTVNTEIRWYVIGTVADTPTWPDAFASTNAARSVTNTNILDQLPLLQSTLVTATSNIAYPFIKTNTVAGCLGYVPNNWLVYLAHNTAVNLNSTGGNHLCNYQGWYFTNLG